MGGLARCVACGEVQWNLRLGAHSSPSHSCRICGEELKAERRRLGRRFDSARPDRRVASSLPADAGELRGGAASS